MRRRYTRVWLRSSLGSGASSSREHGCRNAPFFNGGVFLHIPVYNDCVATDHSGHGDWKRNFSGILRKAKYCETHDWYRRSGLSISKRENIQGINCHFGRFNRLHQMLTYGRIIIEQKAFHPFGNQTCWTKGRRREPIMRGTDIYGNTGDTSRYRSGTCVQWLPCL